MRVPKEVIEMKTVWLPLALSLVACGDMVGPGADPDDQSGGDAREHAQ